MSAGLTAGTHPLGTAGAAGKGFARSRAFEVLSRGGFVARGVVWGIIGILALKLALGHGGKTTTQQGALHTVVQQPFGKILLTLVAIGLGGYSFWRLVRAAIGHGRERADSAFDRVSGTASGISYGVICAFAVQLLLGADTSSTAGNTKHEAGGVLAWPAGNWIVGIAGAVMIGTALYQGYRGVTRKFLEDSKVEQMGPRLKAWIARLGTMGHLARMVVFGLVGIFLVKAAINDSRHAAIGLDGAMDKLVHRAYGPWFLGFVATGLIAFAIYSLSDARYRRI